MSLLVKKDSVAATSGTQQVRGVGFRSKVVMLWLSKATANTTWTADASLSIGMATEYGGSVQQVCATVLDQDGLGTSDTAAGSSTSTVLLGYTTSATPTQDFAATLAFDNDGFDLVWSDAPAAGYVVHYMCLAGTDISAAKVGSYTATAAVATQDITVNSGFGNPDLVFDLMGEYGSGTCAALGFGWGYDDTHNQSVAYDSSDGTTSMNVATYSNATLGTGWLFNSTPGLDHEFKLSAKASWPTDGFQISYSDQAVGTKTHLYCALKGSFNKAVGSATSPISDGNQDINAGFVPAAALVTSDHLPTHSAIDTTHADLGGISVGAYDGTTQGLVNIQQDDANTNSVAKNISDTGSLVRLTGPGSTPTNLGVGVASFSGNNLRIAWTGVGATGRQLNYLILGSSVGVPSNTVAPAVTGTPGVGNVLTTTDGTWTDSPTGYTYQWKRGTTSIGGATSSTYTQVINDIGSGITCEVTATNAAGSATAASNSVLVPAPSGLSVRIIVSPTPGSDNPLHSAPTECAVIAGETMVLLSSFSTDTLDGDFGSITDGTYTWVMDHEYNPTGAGGHSVQAWSTVATSGLPLGATINVHVKGGTLVGANALNSTTINVNDTSQWPNTGSFDVLGTTITYTGKTSTSFTGCSAHAAYTGGETFAKHGNSPYWMVLALNSGDARTMVKDVSAAASGFTNAPNSGSVTTTGVDSIALGFHQSAAASAGWWTPDSPWVEIADSAPGTESSYNIAAQTQILSATTSLASSGTFTAGGFANASSMIVTYRAASLGSITGIPNWASPIAQLYLLGGANRALALRLIYPGATGSAGSTTYQQALTATLSFSGAVSKLAMRALTGSLSFSGSQSKVNSRSLAAMLSFTGGSPTRSITRALTGSLSFVGVTTKRTSRTFTAAALSFTGAFKTASVRFVSLTGSLGFSGVISRTTLKNVTGGLSFTGGVSKLTSYIMTAALSFTGAFTKRTSRAITAALSFSGLFGRGYTKTFTAALSFAGSVQKTTLKSFSGGASFTGSIAKSTFKRMTAALSFAGSLSRLTRKKITAAVSFAGSLITGSALFITEVLLGAPFLAWKFITQDLTWTSRVKHNWQMVAQRRSGRRD